MPGFSAETIHQIFNDSTGERIEVGPDRDGLDLIEIRQYGTHSHKPAHAIVVHPDELVHLARALCTILGDLKLETT